MKQPNENSSIDLNENTNERRKPVRKNRGMIFVVCLLFLALAAVCFYSFSLFQKHNVLEKKYQDLKDNKDQIVSKEVRKNLDKERELEREEVMETFRTGLSAEEDTLKFLRKLYGEDYLVYQRSSNYLFRPLLDVTMADYSKGAFITDETTGLRAYEADGKRKSKSIVDVSKYQGDIDWKAVKTSGIEGAMIRAGVRGYGSGEIVADTSFDVNMKGALAEDLSVGAYFFSEAVTTQEAKEEADFLIKALKPYKVSLPVVMDLELIEGDEARNENVSKDELTRIVLAFLETIEEAGYEGMLYGNIDTISDMVDLTKLKDYKLWFAYYSDDIYIPYKVDMWQYASDGKINGISTDCDLNIMFTE